MRAMSLRHPQQVVCRSRWLFSPCPVALPTSHGTLIPHPRCREMLRNSPTALRVLKAAMNAAEDGQAGIQVGPPYGV